MKRTTLAILLAAGMASATPEYGRKTAKECSYCHPGKGFEINEAGKYYQEHHKSLKGYVPSVKPDAGSKGVNPPKQTGHS